MQATLEQRVAEQTAELRDLVREQKLILEALPLGVVHVMDRRIVRADPRAAELFGWDGDELLGLSTESVYAHPEDHTEIGRVAYAALAEGRRFRADLLLRRKDDSTFWGRLIGQALDPARPMHASIWIIDNIDDDKALEARLQQARQAAEAANRAKDAFMANMSHELRTPLGSVLGFAQILELDERLDDRQREQHQVLSNLVDNALKYTAEGEVWVSAGYAEDELRVEVGDTGVGNAAADAAHIFERFQRIQTDGTASDGAGLGLAIVNRLVAYMGGRISVERTPGAGSRFALRIPAERVSDDDDDADADAEAARLEHVIGYERREGSGPLRILIVDDEAANRRVIIGLLEPLGFRLREALHGRDALALCADWRPDLILMDLRMPVMDGLEATRALRADEATRRIPVVAVTAAAFSQDRAAAREAGCSAHPAKPVLRSALLKALATLLPLRWRYRSVQAEAAADDADGQTESLPPAALATLAELVQQGNINAIGTFAETLTQRSTHPRLASSLSRLAARYDMAGLRRLVAELEARARTPPRGPPPWRRPRSTGGQRCLSLGTIHSTRRSRECLRQSAVPEAK
jgi:PAS domain S-box-containing protein